MNQEVKDIFNQRRKLFLLEYAKTIGNTRKACKELSEPKSSFYDWKKAYARKGEAGLWLNIRSIASQKPHPKEHFIPNETAKTHQGIMSR